jgi:hypothetical protein
MYAHQKETARYQVAKDLFTDLGGNIQPRSYFVTLAPAHWVEYDIDFSGHPIKVPNEEELIAGHLYKHFKSEFEALMWIKGYGLQARYLGHGVLNQIKRPQRTKGKNE